MGVGGNNQERGRSGCHYLKQSMEKGEYDVATYAKDGVGVQKRKQAIAGKMKTNYRTRDREDMLGCSTRFGGGTANKSKLELSVAKTRDG